MRGGLQGEQTESALRRSARFAETPVVSKIVVAGEEGDTPRKSDPVKTKQGTTLGGVGLRKEFFSHTTARVGGPFRGPSSVDTVRDQSMGRGHRA